MSTPAERNIAAEVRGVEEGHRARLMWKCTADIDAEPIIVVKSDSYPGKEFHVRAVSSPAGPVIFTCDPAGRRAFDSDHLHLDGELGIVPCKHAAVAARRLERAGMVRFDSVTGCWLDTRDPEPAPPESVTFAGLNG